MAQVESSRESDVGRLADKVAIITGGNSWYIFSYICFRLGMFIWLFSIAIGICNRVILVGYLIVFRVIIFGSFE